jgi:hypothetical protein
VDSLAHMLPRLTISSSSTGRRSDLSLKSSQLLHNSSMVTKISHLGKGPELYMAEIDAFGPPLRDLGKERANSGQVGPGEHSSKGNFAANQTPGDGGSGSSSESSSESGSEEPRKRRKLHPSDMPWHKRQGESTVSQNPSCAKSVALIRKFNPIKLYVTVNSHLGTKLTKSSHHSTALQLIRRERFAGDTEIRRVETSS